MQYIKFENHSFLKSYVASFKSEAAWLKEADSHGHKAAWFPGDTKRTEKLKELYKICGGKSKSEDKPAEE